MTAREIRALYKKEGIEIRSTLFDGSIDLRDDGGLFALLPSMRSQWGRVVAMHELGHAKLGHMDIYASMCSQGKSWHGTHQVVDSEFEAWDWAVTHLDEKLSPMVVKDGLRCLHNYVRQTR